MTQKLRILADAGWLMTRIGQTGARVSAVKSDYFFKHQATGRVMHFVIKENVIEGLHMNSWVGDGVEYAVDRMLDHLRECEKQLVQGR